MICRRGFHRPGLHCAPAPATHPHPRVLNGCTPRLIPISSGVPFRPLRLFDSFDRSPPRDPSPMPPTATSPLTTSDLRAAIDRLPRFALGHFPTPLEHAERFSKSLG